MVVFLVAIGGIFLLGDFYPELNIKPFIWPVVIILFGLMMIFKPRKNSTIITENTHIIVLVNTDIKVVVT